jgi:hypothetical protein
MQPTYTQGELRNFSRCRATQFPPHGLPLSFVFELVFNGVVNKESHLYIIAFKNIGNGSCFFACTGKLSPFLFYLGSSVAFSDDTSTSVTLLSCFCS